MYYCVITHTYVIITHTWPASLTFSLCSNRRRGSTINVVLYGIVLILKSLSIFCSYRYISTAVLATGVFISKVIVRFVIDVCLVTSSYLDS